jgi:hypothetical protein
MKRLKISTIIVGLLLIIGVAANAQDVYKWENIATTGSAPATRTHAKALFLPDDNLLYVTCGMPYFQGKSSDTYVLDLTTKIWSKVTTTGTPPAGGGDGSGVEDRTNKKLYYIDTLQGGKYGNVKVFNAQDNTWTTLETTGTPPVAVNGAAALDTKANRILYFGGEYFDAGNIFLNDIYALDLGTMVWSKLSPRNEPPAGRYNCSAVYNSVNDLFVLFGGETAQWISDEFWQANMERNAWQVVPSPSPIKPTARTSGSMCYDEIGNRIFLFGGSTGSACLNSLDIFDFKKSSWSPPDIDQTSLPSERAGASMVFYSPDAQDELPYLLIFGGDANAATKNDVWKIYVEKVAAPAPNPKMDITTNQSTYSVGDTLNVNYRITNTGLPITLDVAVVLYNENIGYIFLWGLTHDLSFFLQNQNLITGYDSGTINFISLKFNDPIPAGTYTFYYAFLKDMALYGDIKRANFDFE